MNVSYRLFAITVLLWLSAATAYGASPAAGEYLDRGRELYDLGRWTDARHEFLEARALLTPDDKHALSQADFYLAMCAVELGEYDAAARLTSYLDTYVGSVYLNDVRFALAAEACRRNAFDEAEVYFREVNYKALSPEMRAEYDMRMGYIEFLRGSYGSASEYLQRIPLTSEYSDHATYYLAYIAYSQGDYATARRRFHAIESHEPYARLVPFYLLQIEFDDGNYRYVVDNGDALIERAAGSRRAELRRVMAEAWFHLENYPRTVEYIRSYASDGGRMGRNENYILGYSLYRSARYDEAARYLRKACGADDRLTQNASYHLADCLLRAGDKQAAMQSFAMASNAEYDPLIAEDALFNYGKLQYELGGGAFNGAINVLGRYIAAYPDSERAPEARELLIAAYYNSRDYDAAYDAIKALPSPDGNERAALQKITYFRGLKSFSAGDYAAAERNFAESASVGVSPKYNALTLFWQGEIAYARGQYDKARRLYGDYLLRAPRGEREYALAYYNMGYCDFSQDDMTAAGRNFSRFLSTDRRRDDYRTDALNRMGDVHYSARRFAEAAENYSSAAAAGTRSSGYSRYQYAIALGAQGKTAEKLTALQNIVERGNAGDYNDDAAYELGRTYVSQERFTDGARALESFVGKYPSSPYRIQALTDLGLVYRNLGDDARALARYEQVVESDPSSPQARDAVQGIREIYISRGDVDSYFSYAERAGIETDTGAVARDSLTFAAARSLYLAGKTSQAARAFDGYERTFPKGYYMDEALFYLADCHIRNNDGDNAVAALQRLTSRRRSAYTVRGLELLSSMSYERGDYSGAASAYKSLAEAVTDASAREKALEGYVSSVLRSANDREVETMYEYVTANASSGAAWRRAQMAYADVCERRGDKPRAEGIYRTLSADRSTAEGAEAAYRIIDAAFAAGRYDDAERDVYAFAESDSPDSYWLAKSFLRLGDIYVTRGDTFQARATYQSVADGYSPATDGIVDEARRKIAALK